MSLGIGAMLNYLGGNEDTVNSIEAAKGKEVASVEIDDNNLSIAFVDGSSIKLYDDAQSCCESRYMNCDDDLNSLVGGRLLSFELLPADGEDSDWGCHDMQFLRVMTDKGDIRVTNHNEHNGYYGGFGIVARYRPPKDGGK